MTIVRSAAIIILAACFSAHPVCAKEDALTLMYFYSPDCPSCDSVEPLIIELSQEFKVRGFVSSSNAARSLPFTVQSADNKTITRYQIKTFPALAIVRNDVVKQVITGKQDIEQARPLLRALTRGALTVSEAALKKRPGTVVVAGWVVSTGTYFKGATYSLTDRKTMIRVRPWMPLETIKGPFGRMKGQRLMSDVINKVVALEGTLSGKEDDLLLTVIREVAIE